MTCSTMSIKNLDIKSSFNPKNNQKYVLKNRILPFILSGTLLACSGNIDKRVIADTCKKVAELPSYVVDLTTTSEDEAMDLIYKNTDDIFRYSRMYNIDPSILASCIYTEQVNNVNIVDCFDDVAAKYCNLDTSIGISQVKVSTAKLLLDNNYISNGFNDDSLPLVNDYPNSDDRNQIIDSLTDDSKNIQYAAAYLNYLATTWEPYYPEIRSDSQILGTLYNLGHEKRGEGIGGYIFGIGNTPRLPHPSPEANDFGVDVSLNAPKVRKIMLCSKIDLDEHEVARRNIQVTTNNQYVKCA